MAEWLNLDHFDLGTFVDYVHALKQERDALRAQLPSQGGEAVAEYQQLSRYNNWDRIDKAAFDLGKLGSCPERFRALYTHPADQVAQPDAELVELLRSKFPRIDPCQPVPLDEKAHCCEYTIYVERERLHRIIDAKMASLEVKP